MRPGTLRRGLLVLACLFLAGDAAQAGDLALMVDAGLRTMSNAPDTEKAIFDKARGYGFGLGAVQDRGARWRFGIDVRRVRREGERAFAAGPSSEAFRLGHPLTFVLTEGVASAGYRLRRFGPFRSYAALGAGIAAWNESSVIAGLTERSKGTAPLLEARVGLESERGAFRIGVEGGLTLIPRSVGVGGISKVYGENDLGGLFAVLKVGFVRR